MDIRIKTTAFLATLVILQLGEVVPLAVLVTDSTTEPSRLTDERMITITIKTESTSEVSTASITANSSTNEVPTITTRGTVPTTINIGSTPAEVSTTIASSTTEVPATISACSSTVALTITTTDINAETDSSELPTRDDFSTSQLTTEQATTTTGSYPTTPPPVAGAWGVTYYGWHLSFAIEASNNKTDNLTGEIITTLENCYNDTWNVYYGYAQILQNITKVEYTTTQKLTSLLSDNTTVVRYTALYYAQTIVEQENVSLIAYHIKNVVMARLKNATIGGYNTSDDYINTTTSVEIDDQESRISNDSSHFCQSANVSCPQLYDCYNGATVPATPCYQVCYKNNTDNADADCCWSYTDSLEFIYYCATSNEDCYPNLEGSGYSCSCAADYYYLSGECRLVWVSFTVLTVIVIVVCVVVSIGVWICVQRRHSAARLGSELGGKKNMAYDKEDEEIPRNFYDNEPPPTSYNSNEKYPDNQSDEKSQTALKSYESTHKDVGYNSDDPLSSSDDDGSDSHIPIELQQSPAYMGFQANLAVVDSTANYFQNRPKINVKIDTEL